jgi:hypothetical protein
MPAVFTGLLGNGFPLWGEGSSEQHQYIAGLIRDDGKDTLTAVHVPLAMAFLALAIWLPVRAGRR